MCVNYEQAFWALSEISHIPSDLVVNGSSHMVRAAQPSICR
jgi:hypothetical protein